MSGEVRVKTSIWTVTKNATVQLPSNTRLLMAQTNKDVETQYFASLQGWKCNKENVVTSENGQIAIYQTADGKYLDALKKYISGQWISRRSNC
jgi:hypothetical protein